MRLVTFSDADGARIGVLGRESNTIVDVSAVSRLPKDMTQLAALGKKGLQRAKVAMKSGKGRIPIDSVKIDRSFIQGLGEPGQDSSVVEAIMTLAHSLGLTVVAEGVENDRELAEVRRLGCDEIQGFALAPPAPPEQMGSLRRP